jgi:hypothetical protein
MDAENRTEGHPLFRILVRLFAAVVAVAGALAVGWLLLKSPSHDRDWKTEYARLPAAEFDGDRVTIRNVRNFSYRPDGGIRAATYGDRTYDLSGVKDLWYGISHFYDYGLAHTFLSFGFEDGSYLVISVEARQEIGESYHPFTGLLRNYELIFVVADERDVIGLRTHIRGERVYLYKIRNDRAKVKRLLTIMLDRVNEIHTRPEFYNTLTDNCTTSILRYAERLSWVDRYLDYRVLLPGYSDELAYEIRVLATDLSLTELRKLSRLDPTRTDIDDPGFSVKMRGGTIDPPVAG